MDQIADFFSGAVEKEQAMRNFLLLFFIAAVFSPIAQAQNDHLLLAMDIIRHGDRTPQLVIPNNPYSWSEGLGELTALGMRQTFQLGSDFRKMYIEEEHLLPTSYQAGSIYIRSTDYDRTLMSAQSVLYGLYPLGTGPTLFEHTQIPALPKAFQPVPIHTLPRQDDCLLIPACRSKNFFDVVEKYVSTSPEWRNKTKEYQNKLKEWSIKTGFLLRKLDDIVKLGDNLAIREMHGVPLPPGIDEDESKDIQNLMHWVVSSIYRPLAVGQYGSQELLVAIAHYLKNSLKEETKLKYILFSAHDSTLMSLMSAFHNPLPSIPPYASDIKLLLFRQADTYIVRISYNGTKIKIPFCKKEDCTLDEFIAFVEKSKI
jgi:lysosomal acid phosphatase